MNTAAGSQHKTQIGNPEQWEAISFRGRRCLVLACPGSGKTFVLVRHIWYLTRYLHVPPSEVLVLTFSRAAALQLRSRYRKLCSASEGALQVPCSEGSPGADPSESAAAVLSDVSSVLRNGQNVTFGTFHSVFYHILQASAAHPLQLISDVSRNRLIHHLACRYLDSAGSDKDVAELTRFIAEQRLHQSDPSNSDTPSSIPDAVSADRFTALRLAARQYEAYLQENSLLDFDGMILQCHALLQNDPSVRKRWQQQFSCILIDEFQDISPLQYATIRLLLRENRSSRLFCVGDDDQSIYSFRGSDPRLMRRLLEDDPETKQIRLRLNYRCGSEIIRAAAEVIRENENRLPKEQKAAGNRNSLVRFLESASAEEEYRRTADLIREHQQLGSVAVICRTHAQAESMMRGLQGHGIQMKSASQTWGKIRQAAEAVRTQVYRETAAYGRLSEELSTGCLIRRDLFLVLNRPERYLTRELFRQEAIPVTGVSQTAIRAREWQDLISDLQILSRLSPSMFLRYLLQNMGYESWLQEEKDNARREGALAALEEIRHLADRCRNRQDFFHQLEHPEDNGEGHGKGNTRIINNKPAIDGQPSESVSGAAEILTMHASKGLEFDTVILPDLNEGIVPSRKAAGVEGLEEERRLFYVAMTRARTNLFLLYLRGTEENPRLPSRFLTCLGVQAWKS